MFDISKFLGGVISPKVGLALIRNRLQSELNKLRKPGTPEIVIPAYRLIINNLENKVYFVVNNVTFPYADGDQLSKMIVAMVKEKFKGKIDLIVIDYTTDGSPVLTCAYENEQGEKLSQKIIL